MSSYDIVLNMDFCRMEELAWGILFTVTCLDISSEHVALEIANRVEAAIYVWRRRAHSRSSPNPNRSTTKSSWEIVKDFMVDGDKRELLADRAENILVSLKQRFPGLSQTTLDTSKIQCNKVGSIRC